MTRRGVGARYQGWGNFSSGFFKGGMVGLMSPSNSPSGGGELYEGFIWTGLLRRCFAMTF